MRRALRWIFILLVILLIAVAIALVWAIRSPFPKTSGTIDLAGLTDPVTVKRDDLGVPHLYATNEDDLFFAQGYVHAQDRFWQMEFWRHTSMGRLSEIAGSSTVETDKFIRNIGWNRMAQATVDHYREKEPDMYAVLEAYSAGVNAYIDANKDNISFNQTLLNLTRAEWEIETWEPVHTVAWGIVMAWDLRGSGDLNEEQELVQLESLLGEDLMEQVWPNYPQDRPIIAPPPYDEPSSVSSPQLAVDWSQFEMIGELPDFGFALGDGVGIGSNNWVVAGEHTVSGAPLLADDPHLGVQMPSIWYWMGLHAPGYNVAGMTFAGVPGVVVGHNDEIAWGVTNMSADTMDVYVETVHPENQLQYEFNGEWRNMDVIEERIAVSGGEDVVLEVRETVHGPILNTIDDELTEVLSVRWAAFEPSRILKAVVLLNRATNYDEFRSALSYWDTSGQNFVYADQAGNIAYQSTGRYPVRDWDGRRPVDGRGEMEWDGFIPFDEMPRLFNPDAGYIVTANNAIVDETFPFFLSHNWASGDRAQRIEDMLRAVIDSGGKISAETYATMHNDSYDLLFDSYLPLFSGLRSDDADVQAAIERVRGWDGQLVTDSVPASIFEVFLWKLHTAILTDDLGAAADDIIGNGSSTRQFLHAIADRPSDSLWDDKTTQPIETQNDQILSAMHAAVEWLQEEHGNDSSGWTWGDVHQVTFSSDPLGQSGIAPVEMLVNRGPYPVSGGSNIVNANSFSWGENFGQVRANPSMRLIIDLADYDASLAIHPTGQSGHPYHAHYSDMIQLWLDGDYHPFVYSDTAVDASTVDTLILAPD